MDSHRLRICLYDRCRELLEVSFFNRQLRAGFSKLQGMLFCDVTGHLFGFLSSLVSGCVGLFVATLHVQCESLVGSIQVVLQLILAFMQLVER